MKKSLAEVAIETRRRSGAPGVIVAFRQADGSIEVAADGCDPRSCFRIASVTKSFVSATVHSLYDQAYLSPSSVIRDVATTDVLEPLIEAGYRTDLITVDDLLRHSSGLPDHAGDPDYLAAVLADPDHVWSRTDQLRWAVSRLPAGAPGERVAYSDTGYIILGAIIESLTGAAIGSAVREILGYERLGLNQTWWERYEQPPAGTVRVPQYVGEVDISRIDPSCDLYGGGGIVSTAGDLVAFMGGLRTGRVLSAASADAMCIEAPLPGASGFGRGMHRLGLGPQWWGHTGFWGVAAGADAEGRAVAVLISEREAAVAHLQAAIAEAVAAGSS